VCGGRGHGRPRHKARSERRPHPREGVCSLAASCSVCLWVPLLPPDRPAPARGQVSPTTTMPDPPPPFLVSSRTRVVCSCLYCSSPPGEIALITRALGQCRKVLFATNALFLCGTTSTALPLGKKLVSRRNHPRAWQGPETPGRNPGADTHTLVWSKNVGDAVDAGLGRPTKWIPFPRPPHPLHPSMIWLYATTEMELAALPLVLPRSAGGVGIVEEWWFTISHSTPSSRGVGRRR